MKKILLPFSLIVNVVCLCTLAVMMFFNACNTGDGGDGADVDLSDYYTKDEVDSLLLDYVNLTDNKWQATKVIDYESGSLPHSGDFTSNGGTLMVFVSGSAYTSVGGSAVGVDVLLDSSSIGDVKMFPNETASHKSLVSNAFVVTGIGAGEHTIQLNALNAATLTDTNDVFSVLVYEVPF